MFFHQKLTFGSTFPNHGHVMWLLPVPRLRRHGLSPRFGSAGQQGREDSGHDNGNDSNAFTRRAEGTTAMKPRKCSYDLFRMNSTLLFFSGLRGRKPLRKTRQIACLVSVILCLVYSSVAQVDRAGLSGTVTDSSGRVLPQAKVTAVQISTGL